MSDGPNMDGQARVDAKTLALISAACAAAIKRPFRIRRVSYVQASRSVSGRWQRRSRNAQQGGWGS